MIDTEKLDKLQRYSRTIAALGLALFFALIVISLWSLWRVRKEVADLEEKKQELTQQVEGAIQQANSIREELQALEAQKALLNQTISEIAKQHPDSVKEAINQVTVEQLNRAPSNQEKKKREYTMRALNDLVGTAPSVARNLTRVYLHIGDEDQRPRAFRIAKQLRQAGYLVPGIEEVGDRAPSGPTQVRCNARTEAEKGEAQKIVNLLQEWGVKAQLRLITDASKPWQYEIWFGSDFN
ncbi:MAG: hypothetical protein ACREAM_11715 [Blastocatellia bacterium]